MTATLQTRRATPARRRWAVPGTLLSIASVLIAGTDLMLQIVQAPPTGIALGHTLFALAICLVGIVLSVTWSGQLLAKSVPFPSAMKQQAATDSAEKRPFLFAPNDPADSSKSFMGVTDNTVDSGNNFAAIASKP